MTSAHNHNDSTIVKNISGTSDDRYKIDNLHKKFIAAGGTDSAMCQVKGCPNPGSATAHVIKTDGRSANNWWLCWVCAKHNNPHNDEPYALRKNAKLVSVRDITGT
jgi:hypothetical protein